MGIRTKQAVSIICATLLAAGILEAGTGMVYSGKRDAPEQEQISSTAASEQAQDSPPAFTAQEMQAVPEQPVKVTSNTLQEIEALAAMEKVAENDRLGLYVNKATAEIAVQEKANGYIWFSNPAQRNEDPIASPLYKSELSAQVLLTYYNDKGQINAFNSFDDSVAKKQFEISLVDQGIRVEYRMGNVGKSFANIPKVIGKKRFETEILENIKDPDQREDVKYKFRLNEQKQVYEVRKLQDYVAEELSAVLEAAGYTAEDAARDNKENGVGEAAASEEAEFTVPVVYSLDGANLVVSVPAKELKASKAYPIASLQVLKFFGAADAGKQGYIFVPDGSGALIRLNNNKRNAEPYSLPVYGNNGTFDVKEQIQTNEVSRLPVFGLKQNDHALLGIIEDGEAGASITADISGRNDSYNTVSSKFEVTAMDYYTLSSGTKTSAVPMFETGKYQGNFQVRYAFLAGPSADYTGMAAAYRNYLAGKYKLQPLQASADAPFVLELEGAFRKNKSFLGIPYKSTESLTTFDEAKEILEQLKAAGVKAIDLRFVGWFNGGIRHSSPSDLSVAGVLGGKKGFLQLAEYMKENGFGFYPDTAFLEKYKGSSGAAMLLDRGKAEVYGYNPVTHAKDTSKFSHYILAPAQLPKQVNGFLKDYAKLGAPGLSLRDLGREVHSDFNPDHPVSRQDSLFTSVKELEVLQKQAGALMVEGGNAYSLPFAQTIVNAPMRSSRLNITDEEIPFYQIALHGYFDLAGAPYNMDELQNPRLSMLKSLETGSAVYYQWFASDASKVKDTDYNDLYALSYRNWLDEAVRLYQEANPVLAKVRSQVITSHRQLAPGVVRTVYQNGVSVTINYNQTAVAVDGLQLQPQSYRVGGE
ncbi:hypothetical protein G8C92_15510 [Paenibacillus donghaensis]|uniref:DUF5696 domain-containing protein n=1 Tax=Paenibacillus donghaensis TaxID=414771 RepID=UPI00188397CD|nr:DUF5696 domain-containing protein [Paenibacillus donghaensis]MBE9915427.1 hypothetical protein [Paenibacillus donghaensis]